MSDRITFDDKLIEVLNRRARHREDGAALELLERGLVRDAEAMTGYARQQTEANLRRLGILVPPD